MASGVNETCWMSAGQLVAAFAAGELSPVEVIANAFDAIARHNPVVNAVFLTIEAAALAEAARSELRWKHNKPNGTFDGVPTVVKEGLDAAGLPNYRGSAARSDRNPIARFDAPSVERLKRAGAIVLGKTSQADYGILATGLSSRHGPVHNPFAPAANTSGSSGGTAAAIASGFCPVGIGTDIVGSIRQPASFCGLWGFKPTFGVVPYSPPGAPGLSAGPLARTIDDAVALFEVISGQHPGDPQSLPSSALVANEISTLRGLSIGLIPDFGFGNPTSPPVLEVLHAVESLLHDAGANLTTIEAPFQPDDLRCAERFYQTKIGLELSELPPGERERSPAVDQWCRRADNTSALELQNDLRALACLRVRTAEISHGFDLLLTPTVATPPYPASDVGADPDDPFRSWSNCFLFNLTEQPALSVPAGTTPSGLPIGVQLVGPRFHDRRVLQIGRELAGSLAPMRIPAS